MPEASITEFLEARIAEDEAEAAAASPGPWHADSESSEVVAVDGITVAEGFALSGTQLRATTQHIARHDPARVLAECTAKRAIIEAHPIVDDVVEVSTRIKWGFACETCFSYGDMAEDNGYCDTLRALAAVYKDHPDYRQEWAL